MSVELAQVMTATAEESGANGSKRFKSPSLSKRFIRVWLTVVSVLLLAGIGVFGYLTISSPLTLLAGGDRPIAAATAFVPTGSSFTVSLLTKPDKLISLQRAMIEPSQRQQARDELDQIKQNFQRSTGLDYDRDIQPWIGNELTFSVTPLSANLDGQQSGYLLAIEIAPEKEQQARDFLQFFWQQQSLVGDLPEAITLNGARVLYQKKSSPRGAGHPSEAVAATAMVGNQFVLLASDVSVLRHSLHATQAGTNLAQDKGYRQAVSHLPETRIGLAYLDTVVLTGKAQTETDNSVSTVAKPHSFAAVGLSLSRTGLVANAWVNNSSGIPSLSKDPPATMAALQFLPDDTNVALVGHTSSQLESALSLVTRLGATLPDFLSLGQSGRENLSELALWPVSDYVLGALTTAAGRSAGKEWILAVNQEAEGIRKLDEAASNQGYSTVPIDINGNQAIAWTRLKIRSLNRSPSRRSNAASSLETEILGLHLLQGSYEIFASSLSAMESALSAAGGTEETNSDSLKTSLKTSESFVQSLAAFPALDDGPFSDSYLYLNWPAVSATAGTSIPLINQIETLVHPIAKRVTTVVVACKGAEFSLAIQLKPMASQLANTNRPNANRPNVNRSNAGQPYQPYSY